MKQLVIGDIHGCFEELQELLDLAALGSEDQIIALGDIVDRGPCTPEVFAFFESNPNACSLMGNHERKHIRSFDGEIPASLSQRISRYQFGEALYGDAIEEMARFPLYLDLPDALLVHGAYDSRLPLEDQHINVLAGTLSGTNHLKETLPGPWYEFYEEEKPLIVGHDNHGGDFNPFIWNDRVYFLDTGCVRGGRLTGILLPEFKIISVKARASYWTGMKSWFSKYLRSTEDRSSYDRLRIGDQNLKTIFDYVVAEHERIMRQLAADDHYLSLPSKRRVQEYARRVKGHPLRACFHRLRSGKLTFSGLRNLIRSPENAEAMVAQLQI